MLAEFFAAELEGAELQEALEAMQVDDAGIVEMFAGPPEQFSLDAVLAWMRAYRLFQGRTAHERASAAQAVALVHQDGTHHLTDSELVTNLHAALHAAVPRGWLSASSKLAWCFRPATGVMFDSQVARALTVLEMIEPTLAEMDCLGTPPARDQHVEIGEYYRRYALQVCAIRDAYQIQTQAFLAARPHIYGIRLIDKLLWRLGDRRHLRPGQAP